MIGFITIATHKRILSNKEAEAEGMARRLRLYADALKKMHGENIELEAKLAVFTAPRQRDDKGRYQPLSRKGRAA